MLAVDNTKGYTGDITKSASVITNDPQHDHFNLILKAHFEPNKK